MRITQKETGKVLVHRLGRGTPKPQYNTIETGHMDIIANGETKQPHFASISLLRILAMLMVVYDHTCPFILNGLGVDWLPMKLVDRFIVQPFGIVENFGYLGVCLFFLISGFLTAQSLQNDTRAVFATKRFRRIVPSMIVATVFLYLFQYGIGRSMGVPTYWAQFGPLEWLESAFLIPYFIGQPDMIFGITWFLAPLVMFYICTWLLMPVAKRTASIYILIMFGISLLNLTIISRLNLYCLNLSRLYSFVVIPLLGEIIYWIYTKDLSVKRGGIYCCAAVMLYLCGTALYYPESMVTGGPLRCANFLYAICIFIATFALEHHIPNNKTVGAVDKHSMAVYLCHMQIAQLLLPVLIPVLGVSCTMLITYAVIALSAIFQTSLSEILKCGIRNRSMKKK